jgi:Ankyrin repeats (3 copies)
MAIGSGSYVSKSSVTAGQVPEVTLSDEEKVIKIVGPMTEVERTRFLEFFEISGIDTNNEAAVLDFYRNYRYHLTPGESIGEAQRIFVNAAGMNDETLISRAIRLEKFHLLPDLLACGAEAMKAIPNFMHHGRNSLALAIARGAPLETLELLIKAAQKECTPSGKSCMAIQSGGTTPLFTAALEGNATCIPLLVAAGADIDEVDARSGDTPLVSAVRLGNGDACEALIAAGANVQTRNKNANSALFYAIVCEKLPLVTLLLAHRAELDTKCCSELALRSEMIIALVELTPLPLDTLLVQAISGPGFDLDLIKFLVTKGADINRTTADGRNTALSFALRLRNRKIATILLEHGAVVRPEHFAEFANTFPPAPGSAPL